MEEQLQIMVKYKEPNAEWNPVETQKALDRLSGSWEPSEIIPMLKDGQQLFTPFAFYKLLLKNRT